VTPDGLGSANSWVSTYGRWLAPARAQIDEETQGPVHEFFSGRRSGTSEQLRDEWLRLFGLVQLFRAGQRTVLAPKRQWLDTQAHPQMFLVALAQRQRPQTQPTQARR